MGGSGTKGEGLVGRSGGRVWDQGRGSGGRVWEQDQVGEGLGMRLALSLM